MEKWTDSLNQLIILYGSETGNAQDVAERLQQMAISRNLLNTQISAMDDFPIRQLLPQCKNVVFIVSTTGDGETPFNMRDSWKGLLRRSLPTSYLSNVSVAVFGLGDSSYAKYNSVGRKLHARLLQLGATELVPRGLGDDQHALGYFGVLNPWLDSLWSVLLGRFPLPIGWELDDSPPPLQTKYTVNIQTREDRTNESHELLEKESNPFYEPPPNALHKDLGVCIAPVLVNQRLTSPDWKQDVRHVVLDIKQHFSKISTAAYCVGAIADIYPENTPESVDNILKRLNMEADTIISITQKEEANGAMEFPSTISLKHLFTKYLDIQGTPRGSFFGKLSRYANDKEEREKLEELASPDGVDLLYDYCIREKKTYGEALVDFPSVRLSLDEIIALIPKLKPRSYSIASSPSQYPGEIHLSVAIVDFQTPYKRRRKGVFSQYVENLSPQSNQRVAMWLKPGSFYLPNPMTDMLLIGPGTGVAAMRAIAQERALVMGHNDATSSRGKTHLFFGCRHELKDYIYSNEWQEMLSIGALSSLHTAFSRDQDHKVYVQTRLIETKEMVYSVLINNGIVFVSGSAKRMPADVFDALRDILRSEGKLSKQEADMMLKKMQQGGRYVVESWS